MNSFNLVASIEEFFESSPDHQPFIEALKIFSDYNDGSMDIFRGVGTGQNINQAASNFHQRFANLGGLLPQIRNRYFFPSQEKLRLDIAKLSNKWPESLPWFEKVLHGIDQFAEMYDNYIRMRNVEEAFALAINAKNLQVDIEGMFQALQAILKGFQVPEPGNGLKSLTIYFAGYVGIVEIADKLHALNDIYKEACDLLGVSVAEFPLTVAKLESGSFFVNLVGSTLVISAIISWIGNGASYIYRNTTTEGQISSITQKAEAIDTIIGLRKSLADANIDTSQMDHHIQKSSVKLAARLEVLLTGPGISINGEMISRQSELGKIHSESLEYRKPLKIEMSGKEPPSSTD